MKKTLRFFTIICLVISFSNAFTVKAQTWALRDGYGATGSDKGTSICTDASGNVYIAGSFASSAITFGATSIAWVGANDVFVAKFNSSGVAQWAIPIQSPANDFATGIATDGTSVYVTGTFSNTMNVSGAGGYTTSGGNDGYVVKLAASTGATSFVTTFGGASNDAPQSICLDPSGNIYVSGNFLSAPGSFGSFSLSPTGGSGTDLFILKMDATGTILWANNGGSSAGNDNVTGSSVCYIPSLAEVMLVGGTNNASAGNSVYGSVTLATSTGNDIVMLEVNASTGAFVSGKISSGTANEEALATCYDPFTTDIFIAGFYGSGTVVFGSITLTNSGSSTDEIFYTRYNPYTDAFVWAKSAGANSTGSDRARSICTNSLGHVIIGGVISPGTSSFPTASTPLSLNNTRTTGGDPFLAGVSVANGNAVWVSMGSADNTTTNENAFNAIAYYNNTIWGTGVYTSNITFSPLASLANVTGVQQDVLLTQLTAPPPLSATQSQVNLTCNGVCTGSGAVVASGGTSPYTYSWSPSGGSGATASSLCATNYTVTITDASSTAITKTFTITQPPAIVITPISQTNVSCYGGSNGAASVTASGGTGALTYNWTPGNPTGDGTNSVTGLTSNTWTVTVTDANSCTATRTFNVTQPASPVSGTTVVTNVSCFGGSNGAINLTPTGGSSGYTFNWLPSGPTTEDRTGLTAGTYSVQITDANGCTGTVTATVTQPTSPVSGTTVVTNVACFGGSNGAINLTPNGGSAGYTFNWLPSGPTTEDRTGLTAATYSVQITDVNGCTGTVTATVTQPTSPVSGTTVVTNVSCFGGSNGAINLTPSGGTGAGSYTFNWLPSGPTTEDRTGRTAGTYSVQITDANGCTGTVTATITQPTSPVTGTTVVTNVSCFGGSNGAINLTSSGGSGGYTYNWLPSGPTTEDRTGLVAGTYSVQITDVNGCTGTVTATVTQPISPVSGTTVVTNVSCFGGSNGAINLTSSGGSGGYTYNWLPSGPTTEDRTVLVAGTYSVQITDVNGCTGTVTATVTQPTSPVTGTTVVTNVSCFGGSNGVINLTSSGGSGGYTYNWLPSGPTTEDRTGLTSATYSVEITDINGCTGTVTATITQPTTINTATGSQTNVTCNGGTNGIASITPSGGTPGYTYAWAPSGGTAATVSGLAAGSYTVTVTDANGCTVTKTYTITEPSAITATTSQTNVTCNGGENGSATVTASGGTGGYAYSWAPSGGTDATASDLAAGSYTCTITDDNTCSITKSFTITEPSAITATTSQTNVTCNGGNIGSATVTASGGTGGYTYSWAPSGGTDATASDLAAGSYTCTITDDNTCSITKTFTITEPSAITATTSQTNVTCNGGNTGSATVTASGGTGGYAYSWAPSGGTDATASDLAAGSYTCTITDDNTCSITKTFTITEPSAITATTSQTNVTCNGGSTGSATVTPSGGTGGYAYSWAPSGGTDATASDLTAGSYTCTITDDNTCSITKIFTITEPSAIIATTSQTNVSCTGASTGTASVTASGGAGGYTYSWAPSGGTDAMASDLAAGSYTCTITDDNTCSITKTFSITEPSSAPGANNYSLPASDKTVINIANDTNFVAGSCELVSVVMASGTNPVSGSVTNKVWVEATVPTDNGLPFVQRHYEITPAANASTATGTVTLYFTQDEFDNFNAHSGSTLDLPVNPSDDDGKANLRIGKYKGISGDGTGLPSSYSSTSLVIDPDDNDIVWNATSNTWEVTFDVDGFSGFIVQTSVSVLPVTWVSFTIKKQDQSVILNWSTAAEQNTKDFTVQHSVDGIHWQTAGVVTAAGNSSSHTYTYIDNNTVKGYNYYRIMQTDMSGKISYSEMRVLELSGDFTTFTVAGNIISNGVLQIEVHQSTAFSLYEMSGKLLWIKQFAPGLQSIDVSRYAKGIYLLKTKGKTQKILLQ